MGTGPSLQSLSLFLAPPTPCAQHYVAAIEPSCVSLPASSCKACSLRDCPNKEQLEGTVSEIAGVVILNGDAWLNDAKAPSHPKYGADWEQPEVFDSAGFLSALRIVQQGLAQAVANACQPAFRTRVHSRGCSLLSLLRFTRFCCGSWCFKCRGRSWGCHPNPKTRSGDLSSPHH